MLGPVTQAMRLGSKTQPTASRTRAATSASAASSCTGSASCGVSGSCTQVMAVVLFVILVGATVVQHLYFRRRISYELT